MRLDAVPWIDPGTGAAGCAAVWVDDVTDMVLASESARRSRGLFSSLLASMSEGVAMHELVRREDGAVVDYRIVDVNPSF
jgi:PAS domain-containing protein